MSSIHRNIRQTDRQIRLTNWSAQKRCHTECVQYQTVLTEGRNREQSWMVDYGVHIREESVNISNKMFSLPLWVRNQITNMKLKYKSYTRNQTCSNIVKNYDVIWTLWSLSYILTYDTYYIKYHDLLQPLHKTCVTHCVQHCNITHCAINMICDMLCSNTIICIK